MKILLLAVPPFSGTWAVAAWLLTALPMPKAVPAGLVCGGFVSVFGLSEKAGTKRRWEI